MFSLYPDLNIKIKYLYFHKVLIMNIVTLLSAISLVIYLILGIYVLTINIKSKTNILFSLVAFSLASWSFIMIFASMIDDKEIFFYWIKGTTFFAIIFVALNLHFFIELTLDHKFKKIFQAIIYIPAFFLIFKYTFSKELLFFNVIRQNNLWIIIYLNSLWTYLFFGCYVTFYTLISLFLLYLWGHRSTFKKVKLQSRIIFITLFIGLLLGMSEALILPNITSYKVAGITPELIMIWILGIFYSITRYRFLSFTPDLVSNDIISDINELIIFLNSNLKIIHVNKKTEELAGEEKNKIINKDFKEFVLKYDLIKNEVDKMLKNQYKDFSCRFYFKSKNEPVLMDAKFSKVFDKFDDLIGILVIGNEVKELKQLKLFYKLSDRETEIIQSMVDGQSNKQIGDELSLVESTVKSHVTHIFNKLGIDNRIELMNLLYEFNVIPSHSAEKKVLVLK